MTNMIAIKSGFIRDQPVLIFKAKPIPYDTKLTSTPKNTDS